MCGVAHVRIVKTRLESRHGIARAKDACEDNINFCKIFLGRLPVVLRLPWQIFKQACSNVLPRRILLSFSTAFHRTREGGLVGWLYLSPLLPECLG